MKNDGHDEYLAFKAGRRAQAARDFDDAKALAREHGMSLMRYTEAHYKLISSGLSLLSLWMLEIYPGNQRLYRVPCATRGQAPWLDLPRERAWTLGDVVAAAAKEMAGVGDVLDSSR
jgi:hypothetical protein